MKDQLSKVKNLLFGGGKPPELKKTPSLTTTIERQKGREAVPAAALPPSPAVVATSLSTHSQPTGYISAPALADESRFKRPDAWVIQGRSLQSPSGGNGRALPVRIGIDFGTAYTKVAVLISQQGRYFVTWEGIVAGPASNLLASEMSVLNEGEIYVGRCGSAASVLRELKMPFIKLEPARVPEAASASAAVFLAWVFRYVRAWLYQTPATAAAIAHRRLAWEVNLGCPALIWNRDDFRSLYGRIGLVAWEMSRSDSSLSLETAVKYLRRGAKGLSDIGLDAIDAQPEFVAQIAGYVKSPQRHDGLHVLADAGAGTLDIATFNVHHHKPAAEDVYPIFTSAVLPRGAHFLMEHRARALGIAGLKWNDSAGIPDAEALAVAQDVPVARVREADVQFRKFLADEFGKVLSYTKQKRYIRAPEWKQELPIFVTGGGSASELYRLGLEDACRRLKVRPRFIPLEATDISLARAGSTAPFHRLSVAHGLTFDAADFGRIIPQQEVEDDLPVQGTGPRPDHEELYSKR